MPLERAIAALTRRAAAAGRRRRARPRRSPGSTCEARQEGRPLAEPGRDALPVNMTLPAGPPEEVAARAREGLRAGYACFKLKVGLPDDAERVAAVREAIGPWPALRVDANGAWAWTRRCGRSGAIEEHDLEFVEQPCRTLRELAEVRERVSTPIAADESVTDPREVRRAVELEACDVVNVKLAGCGGVEPRPRARCARSRAAGLEAFLSSTLDGPWGIAAALQLAASEELSLACGLATLGLFDAEVARALPARRGAARSRCRGGPGLGRGGRRRGARRGATVERESDCQPRVGDQPAATIVRRAAAAGAWPGLLDDRRASRAAPCRGHPLGRRRVALVARSRDRQQRQLAAEQLVPDRLEHALARGPQEQRERARVVAQPARRAAPRPARPTGRRTAAGAPRRPRSPRSAPPPSRPPGARPPRRARARSAGSSMPGGRAHRHHAAVAVRVAQRRPQRQPAAERVAAQHAPVAAPRRSRAGGPRSCARAWSSRERSDSVAAGAPRPRRQASPRCMKPGMTDATRIAAVAWRMIPINRTYAPLQALVDELVALRHDATRSPARARATRRSRSRSPRRRASRRCR